jgi:hypothetical protein
MTVAMEVLSRTAAKVAEVRPGVVRKEAANAGLSETVTNGAVNAGAQTVHLLAETEKTTVVPVVVTAGKEAFLLTATNVVVSTAAAMSAEKEAETEQVTASTEVVTVARTEASTVMTAALTRRAKTGRFLEIGMKTLQTARPAEKVTDRLTALLHVKTGTVMIVRHLSRNAKAVQNVVLPVQTAMTVQTEVMTETQKRAVLAETTKKRRKLLSTT